MRGTPFEIFTCCLIKFFEERETWNTRKTLKIIDQFRYIKIQPNNKPQYEAPGNNYRVCGVYSPEPRAEVYCVSLNFNISKLVYSTHLNVQSDRGARGWVRIIQYDIPTKKKTYPKIYDNYWTRLNKISWFVSAEQINYLPKPKAVESSITLICLHPSLTTKKWDKDVSCPHFSFHKLTTGCWKQQWNSQEVLSEPLCSS